MEYVSVLVTCCSYQDTTEATFLGVAGPLGWGTEGDERSKSPEREPLMNWGRRGVLQRAKPVG